MANLTFVRQPDGTTSMRERKRGADPKSVAQTARRLALTRVSQAWGELSDEARAAWEAYALDLHDLSPTPSLSRARSGYRVFSSLGLKALQVSPEGSVPALPPGSPFYGDGAKFNVAQASLPANRGVAIGSPEFAGTEARATPNLTFTCLVPNSPGVVTELLIQPLVSPGRKGEADKYRTQGFVAFAAAGQTVDVPCPAGTVLCAVRFVEAATGQASGLVPLGRIRVG